MKNQKIWPHWDSTALWQQWPAIKLSPHEKEHALAPLPNTPWPWSALGLACLTSAHACSFTPAGTEFLTLSSITYIYTSEAFRQPVPHYSTSQLYIYPSLWSLEETSGMKVILKHQLPSPPPWLLPPQEYSERSLTFHMGKQGTWPFVCLKRFKMTHRMPQTADLGSIEEIVSPPSQPFYLWIAQALEGDKGSWEAGDSITLVQPWWGCGLRMSFISALSHAQWESTWSWKNWVYF